MLYCDAYYENYTTHGNNHTIMYLVLYRVMLGLIINVDII